MRRIQTIIAPVAALLMVGLVSCDPGSSVQPRGPEPTVLALVNGTVRDANGEGIQGARTGLHIPEDRMPLSYLSSDQLTDMNGDFQILIGRTGDVGDIPTPDTLTVWALAVYLNRIDSAQVQLRFTPSAQAPIGQTVNITIALP